MASLVDDTGGGDARKSDVDETTNGDGLRAVAAGNAATAGLAVENGTSTNDCGYELVT